jgi:hypothetical protein
MTPMITAARMGVKGSRSAKSKIIKRTVVKKQKRCARKAGVGLHLGQGHLARREPGCKSMHDIHRSLEV